MFCNFQTEDRFLANPQSRPTTAPANIRANPVEIKISQPFETFNFEYQEEQEKKKPGFWKSVFGEKKCSNCLKKKSECTCEKRKKAKYRSPNKRNYLKKIYHDSKKAQQNNTATEETKKNGNCPTNCNLPINQRGVGCHLYFCINSKPKKLSKKTAKARKKETNDFTYKCDNNITEDKQKPTVTLICDATQDLETPLNQIRGKDSFLSIRAPRKSPGIQFTEENVDLRRDLSTSSWYGYSTAPKLVYDVEVPNKNSVMALALNKNGENEMKLKTKEIDYNSKKSPKGRLKHKVQNKKKATTNDPFENFEKRHMSRNYQNTEENENGSEQNSKSIKRNDNVQRNIKDKEEPSENIVMPITFEEKGFTENLQAFPAVKIHSKPQSEDRFFPDPRSQTESDNESVSKLKINKRSTGMKSYSRPSAPRNSLFARNSLISMRKERRQSQLEGRVSLILQKLGNIEDRIMGLEKIGMEKNKNIIMGITSNGKKSKVSIKFDKTKENAQEEKQKDTVISQIKLSTKPSKTSTSKILKVKSQNDQIYIQASGPINVIKSKAKLHSDSIRSQQLINENAFQMDAHTIGSNTKEIKCNNPRIVISRAQENVICKCQFAKCCNKWRRISEELKVTQ